MTPHQRDGVVVFVFFPCSSPKLPSIVLKFLRSVKLQDGHEKSERVVNEQFIHFG